MTQEEFNQMLAVAIAQGLGGGTFALKYSGEEINAMLDWVNGKMTEGATPTATISTE